MLRMIRHGGNAMTLVQHLLVTGLFIAAATFPISAQEQADRIFLNGKIITVDEAFSIQQAMAIKENRILAVGTDEEMKPYISSETEVIDLMGKSSCPALIPMHILLMLA